MVAITQWRKLAGSAEYSGVKKKLAEGFKQIQLILSPVSMQSILNGE